MLEGTIELCELCGGQLDADNCYGFDDFPLKENLTCPGCKKDPMEIRKVTSGWTDLQAGINIRHYRIEYQCQYCGFEVEKYKDVDVTQDGDE